MSIETACDACERLLRSGSVLDEPTIAQDHGITPYAAQAARRHAEDRVWALRDNPLPQPDPRQEARRAGKARERADAIARWIPRTREQRR